MRDDQNLLNAMCPLETDLKHMKFSKANGLDVPFIVERKMKKSQETNKHSMPGCIDCNYWLYFPGQY